MPYVSFFSSSPPFCLFSSSFFLFLLLLSEYLPTEHGTHEGKIHKIGYCGSNKQYSSTRVRLLVHSVNYPFTFWNNWSPFSESPFFFTHNRIFIIKKSYFSVVVMKHTISKSNKPLSWHRNFTRITSLTFPGQDFDRNIINQSFYSLQFSFP